MNKEYGYKIDTITIVYIIRNLKRIIPFDLPIDDVKAKSFLKIAPILLECLNKDIVPQPLNYDDEQCKWCQYKKYCEEDGMDNKTLDKDTNKQVKKSVFLL